MTDQNPIDEIPAGIDRRTMLKRGAIVGGALVWTTPVVQSIASPAFAQTSPPPGPGTEGCPGTTVVSGFKFDGQSGPFNVNQQGGGGCFPTPESSNDTPFVAPVSASISPDQTQLTFTLGPNDVFLAICVRGANQNQPVSEFSRTTDPTTGNTTFIFNSPNISNFSVLFENCP